MKQSEDAADRFAEALDRALTKAQRDASKRRQERARLGRAAVDGETGTESHG